MRPGTPITSGSLVVSLTTSSAGGHFYSDSGGVTVITSVTIANGASESSSYYYKDTTAGSPTLTASATGFTPALTTFTIGLVAFDHFVIANIVSPKTAGVGFTITIAAVDALNNTVTSYVGTNSLSDLSGSISPASTTVFVNGVWSGTVTITKARTGDTISTTGSSKSGLSNSFNVVAGALDHFVIASISSPKTAGVGFTITIAAVDASNNTVTELRWNELAE